MILRVEGRGLETSSRVCGGFWKELGCHVGHVADGDGVPPPPPIVTIGRDRFQRVCGRLEDCLLGVQVDAFY